MTQKSTRWDIVTIALLAGIIVGMQVGKVPPVLTVIEIELGLRRVDAGLIASMFYGLGAVFGVFGGMLIDRLGFKSLVITGCVVMAASSFIGSFSTNGNILLATRITEGFGFVALTVSAPKVIAAATDLNVRNFALGIWATYMPVGMAISMLIATVLLESMGWRDLWVLHSIIILSYVLIFVLGTSAKRWQSTSLEQVTYSRTGMFKTLTRPGPWLFGVCFILFSIEWLAFMAWLPTILLETREHSLTLSALHSAFIVFITALGAGVGALLMHYKVKRAVLISMAYLIMGLTAALIFAPLPPASLKYPYLAVAFALAAGLLPAACFAGAAAHAPSQAHIAMSSGFVAQGAAIGSVLGPPLLALVNSYFGEWGSIWWFMLICPTLGLLVVLILWNVERRLDQVH